MRPPTLSSQFVCKRFQLYPVLANCGRQIWSLQLVRVGLQFLLYGILWDSNRVYNIFTMKVSILVLTAECFFNPGASFTGCCIELDTKKEISVTKSEKV